MPKKIECPKNLRWSILWGDQIPHYKSFSGKPGPRKIDQKTIDYYYQGKKYAEQFDQGEEFLESLKIHTEKCEKCLAEKKELREQYQTMKQEQLENLTNQEKSNLKSFGLLD